MKHVHCKLIKAWADNTSLEIEVWVHSKNKWETVCSKYLGWHEDSQYRIKPEEPDYGRIAENGYKQGNWQEKNPPENWKGSANAVIEAYKKHHNLP